MYRSIFLLSAWAATALAEKQTEYSFFFPGGTEGVNPVAEVSVPNPSTTIAHITCPTSVDLAECGVGPGLEYTQIVQSQNTKFIGTMSGGSFTMTYSCDYDARGVNANCGVSMGGDDAQFAGTSTLALAGTDIVFGTATVTKGAELLTDATASGPTSSGLVTATSRPTGAATTGALASGSMPSGTPTASGSGPEETGAAYKYGIEGAALVALAGAAVLNAW
jgi:hypothetical protein